MKRIRAIPGASIAAVIAALIAVGCTHSGEHAPSGWQSNSIKSSASAPPLATGSQRLLSSTTQ
jgi:hypothetical protein